MKRRRNFLLLEVLIAFGLVALCIFPLVYSQFKVLTAEKELRRTLEKQKQSNELFVQFVERLYKGELTIDQLKENPKIEILREKSSGAILKVTFNSSDYQLYYEK